MSAHDRLKAALDKNPKAIHAMLSVLLARELIDEYEKAVKQ